MSAETLRRAAVLMRDRAGANPGRVVTDPRLAGMWLNSAYYLTTRPAVMLAVADWLDDEATKWERNFAATQQPSRGVDEPPGIHYGDPTSAAAGADHHARYALAVARAYLGESA